MGNAESGNPVKNMDKRTARREYRDDFMSAVTRFRKRNEGSDHQDQEPITDEWLDGSIKVFVRKRPIFKRELEAFEFDVATCTPAENTIVIHDARMHNDMKRQLMHHNKFQFDRVFDERCDNQKVYDATARSLVGICCEGGYSTCMVYGQTGSGKTFTMSSIYEQAAYDIFAQLEAAEIEREATAAETGTATGTKTAAPSVSICFFEIAGESCYDLLNAFKPLQLLGTDCVHPFPATEPTVTCAEELIAMVQHGTAVRTTAATGVHAASSRTHAVLRIYVQRPDKSGSGNGGSGLVEGTLTLVDLAGSEQKIDSGYHGKERRRETASINASLMALKECIRARAAGQALTHQYRRNKLTLALKGSFVLPAARTIVISCVSPASKDTEHSLNTLRHACIMHGQKGSKETRYITGGSVTTEEVGEADLTEIARSNLNMRRAGGAVADLRTNNGNTRAHDERELNEQDRVRLRRIAEQRSIVKLLPQYRDMLKFYRARVGRSARQAARLGRSVYVGQGQGQGQGPDSPDSAQRVLQRALSAQKLSPQTHTHTRSKQPQSCQSQGSYVRSLSRSPSPSPLPAPSSAPPPSPPPSPSRRTGNSRGTWGSPGTAPSTPVPRSGTFNPPQPPTRDWLAPGPSPKPSPALRPAVPPAITIPARRAPTKVISDIRNGTGGWSGTITPSRTPSTITSLRPSTFHLFCGDSAAPLRRTPSPARPPASASSSVSSSPSASSSPAPSPSPIPTSTPTPTPTPTPCTSTRRLDFQRLHASIYAAAELVPAHILRRQLSAVLGVQGYSEMEVELMFEVHELAEENKLMAEEKKSAEKSVEKQREENWSAEKQSRGGGLSAEKQSEVEKLSGEKQSRAGLHSQHTQNMQSKQHAKHLRHKKHPQQTRPSLQLLQQQHQQQWEQQQQQQQYHEQQQQKQQQQQSAARSSVGSDDGMGDMGCRDDMDDTGDMGGMGSFDAYGSDGTEWGEQDPERRSAAQVRAEQVIESIRAGASSNRPDPNTCNQ